MFGRQPGVVDSLGGSWRARVMISRFCLARLGFLLSLMCVASPAGAGIPALLQFAEQYDNQQQNVAEVLKDETPRQEQPRNSGSTLIDVRDLRRTLKARDAKLAEQQISIRLLEKQLATLQKKIAVSPGSSISNLESKENKIQHMPPTDFNTVIQLVSRLRQVARGLLDTLDTKELVQATRNEAAQELARSREQEQALKLQINQLEGLLRVSGKDSKHTQQEYQSMQSRYAELQAKMNESTQEKNTIQQQLSTETAKLTVLKEENAIQAASLTDLKARQNTLEIMQMENQNTLAQQENALTALRTEKDILEKQHEDLQQKMNESVNILDKKTLNISQLQDDLESLRKRAAYIDSSEILKDPAGRQNYAAGTALGQDILDLLKELNEGELETHQETILAGVIDAFAGKYQLTTDVLRKSLEESDTAFNTAREKARQIQQKKGTEFISNFKKQKDVKESSLGFWYRVDYIGDESISDQAIVDVVVKETLIDGTVIQDMSLGDNVLSQPISAYPPLFREAIGYLRNHGSITLVVPPELAYGEAGYPPLVPPNSTMVYELRVVNSKKPTSF